MDKKITLIGSKLANIGEEFVYLGEVEECKTCKFRKLCHNNLEVGRKYKIVSVRSAEYSCPIHEGGVKVVEVELADIILNIDAKKALEGVVLNYEPINCGNFNCKNYKFCHPEGIYEGDKFRIKNVLNEKINCENGKTLKKVIVELIK
ncbi:hypothetical protein J422_00941 [Methanocaldococcus villosus KIN24-T80]|uniref:UPF0179 protein J422_00941 n=1 Tax=Methanocaldococcus villosus KIN24-T80 TaxID=1069083 RepID=N6V362_9EURY|nr:UPF0179 family protein [Methanocaldococcus villosus]ENN96693.1 hypothetical protein J422_00941 [Methanocaldococcus villosus KIN24-T80]